MYKIEVDNYKHFKDDKPSLSNNKNDKVNWVN